MWLTKVSSVGRTDCYLRCVCSPVPLGDKSQTPQSTAQAIRCRNVWDLFSFSNNGCQVSRFSESTVKGELHSGWLILMWPVYTEYKWRTMWPLLKNQTLEIRWERNVNAWVNSQIFQVLQVLKSSFWDSSDVIVV